MQNPPLTLAFFPILISALAWSSPVLAEYTIHHVAGAARISTSLPQGVQFGMSRREMKAWVQLGNEAGEGCYESEELAGRYADLSTDLYIVYCFIGDEFVAKKSTIFGPLGPHTMALVYRWYGEPIHVESMDYLYWQRPESRLRLRVPAPFMVGYELVAR